MRLRPASLLLSTFVLLAAAPALPGLDLERVVTGYSLSSWVERDGVPIGPVRALVQDANGYLWLGTNSGLLSLTASGSRPRNLWVTQGSQLPLSGPFSSRPATARSGLGLVSAEESV